jgi:hypothetical protein
MKVSPIAELPIELVIVEYCADAAPAVRPASLAEPAPSLPDNTPVSFGLLTQEKLVEHWKDFIEELKPFNHSVAGVLRSARPKTVSHGIVTIEAFYPFHKDKLSESKTKDVLIQVLKKLFGEQVKVEIVLGKK